MLWSVWYNDLPLLQVWSRLWQASSPTLWSWLKTASCRPPWWGSEFPGITSTSMTWRTAMDSSGWVTFVRKTSSNSLFHHQLMQTMCSPSDLRAEEDRGVHLPHGLLRQHRHRAVGRSDHLQDQEELSLPAGHEVSKTPSVCERGGASLFSVTSAWT